MSRLTAQGYPIFIDARWDEWVTTSQQLKPVSSIFVLVDEHTKLHCWSLFEPQLRQFPLSGNPEIHLLEVPAGESSKSIAVAAALWQQLLELRADRNSLLINLGGGVVGDLGGFVAATYMRGIRFVQVPTTLLSQVDASIGGKVGIDFGGAKNSVGAFRNPEWVWMDTTFLVTVEPQEILSGYAEIIKHALIGAPTLWQTLQEIDPYAVQDWSAILHPALEVKRLIVDQDPFEKGIRKALNFGHTIGHGLESYFLTQPSPITHGHAVALGMMAETVLSTKLAGLPDKQAEHILQFLQRWYSAVPLQQAVLPQIVEYIRQDKKNFQGTIRFAGLRQIGEPALDVAVSEEDFWKVVVDLFVE